MHTLPQDWPKQVFGTSFVNMRDSTGFDESREFAAMSVLREAAVFTIAFMGLVTVASELSAADSDAMHAGPVMNYHRIDERLVTGGHFVGDDPPVPCRGRAG